MSDKPACKNCLYSTFAYKPEVEKGWVHCDCHTVKRTLSKLFGGYINVPPYGSLKVEEEFSCKKYYSRLEFIKKFT